MRLTVVVGRGHPGFGAPVRRVHRGGGNLLQRHFAHRRHVGHFRADRGPNSWATCRSNGDDQSSNGARPSRPSTCDIRTAETRRKRRHVRRAREENVNVAPTAVEIRMNCELLVGLLFVMIYITRTRESRLRSDSGRRVISSPRATDNAFMYFADQWASAVNAGARWRLMRDVAAPLAVRRKVDRAGRQTRRASERVGNAQAWRWRCQVVGPRGSASDVSNFRSRRFVSRRPPECRVGFLRPVQTSIF